MLKYIVLLLIALLPVILGIFGYHGLGGEGAQAANMHVIATALVNIPINALIGGITALLLKRRKAVWWAMMVCFFYSYFGFGITYGLFSTEGGWGTNTLNSSVSGRLHRLPLHLGHVQRHPPPGRPHQRQTPTGAEALAEAATAPTTATITQTQNTQEKIAKRCRPIQSGSTFFKRS